MFIFLVLAPSSTGPLTPLSVIADLDAELRNAGCLESLDATYSFFLTPALDALRITHIQPHN